MDRRNSIGLIGISSLLALQNVFPSIPKSGKTEINADFMKAFAPRWEGLRTHSFEVFEAMPEAQFNYRPTEEIMSFSKLFSHIGKSLDIYAGMLNGTEHQEEKESLIKGEVNDYLIWSFDRFDQALTQLNHDNLYIQTHDVATMDGMMHISDYDIIMLAYNHTVHHKGQATTYQRLVGVTPPQYRY